MQSARGYACPNGVLMDNPCGAGTPAVGTFWYTLVNQCFFAGLTAKLPQVRKAPSRPRSWANLRLL